MLASVTVVASLLKIMTLMLIHASQRLDFVTGKLHRKKAGGIAEVVQFLAVNELSFRGDAKVRGDESNHEENIGGLFVRLFEFAMQKDKQLHSIAKAMPRNAKNTSPEIQNDVIKWFTTSCTGSTGGHRSIFAGLPCPSRRLPACLL